MTNYTKIGLAAVLLLGVSAPAIALDVTTTAGAAANAATDVVVDPTETGSIADIAGVVTKLDVSATVDLKAFSDQSSVKFVTITSLSGDVTALDSAITGKADLLASLHTNVGANAALKAKIEASGYTLDDVLAIESGANGEFTIYIDDRA